MNAKSFLFTNLLDMNLRDLQARNDEQLSFNNTNLHLK